MTYLLIGLKTFLKRHRAHLPPPPMLVAKATPLGCEAPPTEGTLERTGPRPEGGIVRPEADINLGPTGGR